MRIVVADDHPVFREGLAAVLSALPGTDVVGQAAEGEEAVQLAVTLRPDVVVMDLHMPGVSGIEATRRIRDRAPGVAVLVLTMLEGDESLVAALRAGARGYVLKGAGRTEIEQALQTVARGGAVFAPGIADRVLEHAGADHRRRGHPRLPELTERELEVTELLARGLPNASIAARLHLSEKTVRNHVSSVYAKLGVEDRAAAVAVARDAGLGAPAR